MNTLVLTVVVSGEGESQRISHNLVVDGQAVNAALAVTIAGDLSLDLVSGTRTMADLQKLSSGVRMLDSRLYSSLLAALFQPAKPEDNAPPAEPPAEPLAPVAE